MRCRYGWCGTCDACCAVQAAAEEAEERAALGLEVDEPDVDPEPRDREPDERLLWGGLDVAS